MNAGVSMLIKLAKENLQRLKYTYTWEDDKPSESSKLDRENGFEVLSFIEDFMNRYDLNKLSDAHKVEDMLHRKKLADIDDKKELAATIEYLLRLKL